MRFVLLPIICINLVPNLTFTPWGLKAATRVWVIPPSTSPSPSSSASRSASPTAPLPMCDPVPSTLRGFRLVCGLRWGCVTDLGVRASPSCSMGFGGNWGGGGTFSGCSGWNGKFPWVIKRKRMIAFLNRLPDEHRPVFGSTRIGIAIIRCVRDLSIEVNVDSACVEGIGLQIF